MAEMLGLEYQEFKRRFAWDNLYGDENTPRGVSRADARAEDRRRAVALRQRLVSYDWAVLLGQRVAEALECDDQPLHEWFTLGDPGILAARTLHTSHQHWNRTGQGRGAYWQPARIFLASLASHGTP
jgi:hypothetical protein